MKRLGLMLLALQLGCAAQNDASEMEAEHTAATSKLLALGDRGEEVRGVYEYLAKYGYFPNEELAAKYPGFKPLVAEAPSDASIYDDRLAEAVRLFQKNSGLEATGSVDDETYANMAPRSCGWPDGYTGPDDEHGHDKFRIGSTTNANISTWSLESFPPQIGEAQTVQLVQEVLNRWSLVHPNTFTRVPKGQGRMQLFWGQVDGPGQDTNGDNLCDVGCAAGEAQVGGQQLFVDYQENWQFTGEPSASGSFSTRKVDFRSVVVHEFGHILGLGHSAVPDSIMYATQRRGVSKRYLHSDDRNAIRSRFARWTTVATPAPATDVNGTPTAIISNEPVPGGFKIYRLGTTWQTLNGGATRISADFRFRLWVVNSIGQIFYRPQSDTDWVLVSGCATDISVGWPGNVWVVGCDGGLYRGNMDPQADDATLLSQRFSGFTRVGNNGLNGVPALVSVGAGSNISITQNLLSAVDANGAVWGLQNGSFVQLSHSPNVSMGDIAGCYESTVVWAAGKSGTGVHLRNSQETPASWSGYTTQSARRVSTDTNGRPFIVTSTGSVLTTTK